MRQAIPETAPEFDRMIIIERPDGFYWQSTANGEEHGPFATLIAAVHDVQYSEEASYEPGETLEEAAAEIGIADWIDPDTGEPAEDAAPRTEEH